MTKYKDLLNEITHKIYLPGLQFRMVAFEKKKKHIYQLLSL